MRIQMRNNSNITIKKAFGPFQKYNEVKNLSEHTINFYDSCFNRFSNFFDVGQSPFSITEQVYNDYILHLQNDDSINSVSVNS